MAAVSLTFGPILICEEPSPKDRASTLKETMLIVVGAAENKAPGWIIVL